MLGNDSADIGEETDDQKLAGGWRIGDNDLDGWMVYEKWS